MLRRILTLTLTAAALLSCQSAGKKPAADDSSVIPSEAKESVSGYWSRHPWRIEEGVVDLREDTFADFAEIAVAAPQAEAISALGALLDSLKAKDAVSYYIYSGWVEGAFYHPLSPCRNFDLFAYAVGRFETDGIFDADECRPFSRKRDWMALGREGETAITPEPDPAGRGTLVLVLDLRCPSCRRALASLGIDPRWEGYRRVALCCGPGPLPTVPDWEYRPVGNPDRYFDLEAMPFYYVIDPAGVIVQSYRSDF